MRAAKIFLSAIAAAGAATPAVSLSLGAYEQAHDSPATAEYVYGVGNGIVGANAYLRATGKPAIFCTRGLSISKRNFFELLDKQIERSAATGKPYKDDEFIELIMISALLYTFPCER